MSHGEATPSGGTVQLGATRPEPVRLRPGDALIVVDMQNDFLPGGSLAVPQGDEVVPVLNDYIQAFHARNLSIYATRDWHPPNHCSFRSQGGPWPVHCVANSPGAAFAPGLQLPPSTRIISKASVADRETYSGFGGTELEQCLRRTGEQRLFVGGLATDYCVFHTVKDGLKLGFQVFLLRDAVRAVNVHPEDGPKAEVEMVRLGAALLTLHRLER